MGLRAWAFGFRESPPCGWGLLRKGCGSHSPRQRPRPLSGFPAVQKRDLGQAVGGGVGWGSSGESACKGNTASESDPRTARGPAGVPLRGARGRGGSPHLAEGWHLSRPSPCCSRARPCTARSAASWCRRRTAVTGSAAPSVTPRSAGSPRARAGGLG